MVYQNQIAIAVAGSVVLIGTYGKRHGISLQDPAQMANALVPLAGQFMRKRILLLMVNAAVRGTTAMSLASSWAYGEVMGWPHSLHKKIWEAPGFIGNLSTLRPPASYLSLTCPCSLPLSASRCYPGSSFHRPTSF